MEHINLQLGWPSPSLFPAAQILAGVTTVLEEPNKTAAALVYGPDPGYMPLRHNIAKWLNSTYSLLQEVEYDRICITNGASSSLHNILSKFTDPIVTRAIWMVEPSYFLACPIFMDAGFQGRLHGVPEDDEGIDINHLRSELQRYESDGVKRHPPAAFKGGDRYAKLYRHIIYAVPTFSNPSGKTMSLWRRQELVRLAREFDALVVTDDVYDVLRWPGEQNGSMDDLPSPPLRLVDIDRSLDGGPQDQWGNAISNGSFSKIIAPGIRTGWVEAPSAFILALSKVGATCSGGCPSQIAASFVSEMLQSGSLQSHIQKILIPTYRCRSYALLEAVEEHLLPLGFSFTLAKPDHSATMIGTSTNGSKTDGNAKGAAVAGGYFVYLRIPSDCPCDAKTLAATALEQQNLRIAFGDMMTVMGDPESSQRSLDGFGRCVRLCWAWHSEDLIREGIVRLARVVSELYETV